jgi:uncharacterized membrane protein YedE/YeeE
MKPLVTAFGSGLLFALGLGVSGMIDPSKVIGFLDVAGRWDPSLAFVMMGAIAVGIVATRVVARRASPLFGDRFHLPPVTAIDARLVGGSALFGVGWGLSGYCPGPAVLAAVGAVPEAVVFIIAMLAGMAVFEFVHGGSPVSSRQSALVER